MTAPRYLSRDEIAAWVGREVEIIGAIGNLPDVRSCGTLLFVPRERAATGVLEDRGVIREIDLSRVVAIRAAEPETEGGRGGD